MNNIFLFYALVTFAVTFVASRGKHSRTHHRLAKIAMALECLLALVRHYTLWAMVLSVAIALCFLAVYLTDDIKGVSYLGYTKQILRRGWKAIRRVNMNKRERLLALSALLLLVMLSCGALWNRPFCP